MFLNIWYFWRGNIFLMIISFRSAAKFFSIATAMFFWYLIFLEGKNISDNHICLEHVYFATFIFVMSIWHMCTLWYILNFSKRGRIATHTLKKPSIDHSPKQVENHLIWLYISPCSMDHFQKSTRLKIFSDHCTVLPSTFWK